MSPEIKRKMVVVLVAYTLHNQKSQGKRERKYAFPTDPRNEMVSRVCMVLAVMSALKLPWLLEQPSSSVMAWHPCFRWIVRHFRVYQQFIWVGSYGGGSA